MSPIVSTNESSSQSRPARRRKRLDQAALDQDARHEQRGAGGRDPDHERQAERRGDEVHDVGAEHEQFAMGEVDDAEDAEDQRQADPHQPVHRPAHQPLEDQLGQAPTGRSGC